ncbi:MAG: 50S ribosomal protein L1 [Firmicutes bacterium]|nr:50S ribosomal protein L1 [Bacillota bacterium]
MKKYSKKYVEVSKNIDKNLEYNIDDAIKLIKQTSITKFDSTVEIALRLNLDAKKSDQQLKGALSLPHGTGKTKKVLVIAKGSLAEEAKKAGADHVGEKDLIDKIKNESWFDFDVIVATPDMMPELGKIGNILGPRNLMPNPKTGTVTTKVGSVVEDIKKGMVTYKNDKFGNVHTIIGKVSFAEKELKENLAYVVNTIAKAKPNSVKGVFIENITISTTMGPGIKLDKNSFDI